MRSRDEEIRGFPEGFSILTGLRGYERMGGCSIYYAVVVVKAF